MASELRQFGNAILSIAILWACWWVTRRLVAHLMRFRCADCGGKLSRDRQDRRVCPECLMWRHCD